MGIEVQSVLLALLVFNAPSSHSCTTDGKSAVGSQVVWLAVSRAGSFQCCHEDRIAI